MACEERGEGMEKEAPTLEQAEAGMAEMSERYRKGGDLYVSVVNQGVDSPA